MLRQYVTRYIDTKFGVTMYSEYVYSVGMPTLFMISKILNTPDTQQFMALVIIDKDGEMQPPIQVFLQ